MISRRRFLTITAAAFACPAWAAEKTVWRGRAFGAEVSIQLRGKPAKSEIALRAARDTMKRLERLFSIYDPRSAISTLNLSGRLKMPPEFARLILHVNEIHQNTGGLFDPTVQAIFAGSLGSSSQSTSQGPSSVPALLGWENVHQSTANDIEFSRSGMAITLNGIAQGFATDRVSEVLTAYGFSNALVNMGEYRAGNDPVHLEIHDMEGNPVAQRRIMNSALATSSHNGFTFPDGKGHIVSPYSDGKPQWDTVSVVADKATVADGYSTALVLSKGTALVNTLKHTGLIRSAILKDFNGQIVEI